MGENDGYDTVLHKISRGLYTQVGLWSTVRDKCSVLIDAFVRAGTPSKVVEGIRMPSMAFECGVWDGIRNLALIDFSIDRFQ